MFARLEYFIKLCCLLGSQNISFILYWPLPMVMLILSKILEAKYALSLNCLFNKPGILVSQYVLTCNGYIDTKHIFARPYVA